MKKQLPLGLVLEGSSSRSAVLRLPNLADELGPIKSSAVRLARRFSNLIRGGYAVAEYVELQGARLILLRIPDEAVARIVNELCSSELVLNRLSFLLCETWLATDVLEPLRERGASVATLVRVPAMERNWFVLEGQLSASRIARRFLEGHEGRVFEIKMGSKHLLFAAELLSTILPIPLLAAAQHSLRAGGINGNELAALLNHLAQKGLREVIKGVRLPLSGLPPDCPWELGAHFMTTLKQTEPALASFIQREHHASATLISEAWKNAIDGG
jgi:hypothetical protein